MSKAAERIRCYREAKRQLSDINTSRNNVIVIHYSCESFYDRPNGTSARITSIAVQNLSTSQTESFSIHQIAERDKKLSIEEIETHYDLSERYAPRSSNGRQGNALGRQGSNEYPFL